MKFLDQAKIFIKAGNGGSGSASFRREKFIEFGGPDGGDGGNGGSIIFKGTKSLNTLIDYKYKNQFKAKKGEHGKGRNKTGASGKDIVIKVPIGTQIFNQENNELITDITEDSQEITLAKGGKGGFGNTHFKSSTNKAPRKSTAGESGEEMWIWLELKLIADVGVIGLPNAGKSSFVSTISKSKTKIADYPFTTLAPQLGSVFLKDEYQSFIAADIPGLIKDAHKGTGLGHQFLRHIERCKILVHLVDGTVELIDEAYKEGSNRPLTRITPYINTIPVESETKSPGDQNIERRIRSLIRWNAAAMVVKANKKNPELGGHIGTFASAAPLYDVGMNHFWRAKNLSLIHI